MDWIETFYAQQTRWVPEVYLGQVGDHHRARAAQLDASSDGGLTILELGCGGGQIAAALADRGHRVTAIDLNDEALSHARALANSRPRMTVLRGDFYTAEIAGPFDRVCYIDGFGVGSDAEQRRLLNRIASWLADRGEALIDIYSPWYWSRVAGDRMEFGEITREYDFDPHTSTMRDRWWPTTAPDDAVTQVLRCYSPADLRLLLEATPLRLVDVTSGGGFDADGRYAPQVEMGRAMQYLARLQPR